MNYKTPGVFIEEISTFPPSVVPVETAIPVFIGYTEQAIDQAGNSLLNRPQRIDSLLEYKELYGGGFDPDHYRVRINLTDNSVASIVPEDSTNTLRRYYLYNCLQHFYANGGGPCYIVSVGFYGEDIVYNDEPVPGVFRGLLQGLNACQQVDEITLITFPDAVGLADFSLLGSLQNDALSQCNRLQDRFGIFDIFQGDQPISVSLNPIQNFRNVINSQTDFNKYGAVYYPWLESIYTPDVGLSDLTFVDNADGTTPVDLSALTFSTDANTNATLADLVTVSNRRTNERDSIPSALTSFSFNSSNFNLLGLQDQLNTLREAVLTGNTSVGDYRADFQAFIGLIREMALALSALDGSFDSLSTDLQATIDSLKNDDNLISSLIGLIAFEKDPQVRNSIDSAANWEEADVSAFYAAFNGTEWILPNADSAVIPTVNPAKAYGTTVADQASGAATDPELFQIFETLSGALIAIFDSANFLLDQAEKALFEAHPFFINLLPRLTKEASILPPSGAIAGIYATVDRTRGVWKAPANVSLSAIRGPVVKLNNDQQANLNVHSTGKSVNALRSFTGKGTLVWGGRTLAGNDNEWRYVSVRRFFNFAEESIKKATEPFVFEPNDANTWIKVRAMIENFLTIQWRQGALAGASSSEAFVVRVGLPETMTSQDIEDGRIIVAVKLALIRPAEFIIIQLQQRVEGA